MLATLFGTTTATIALAGTSWLSGVFLGVALSLAMRKRKKHARCAGCGRAP